MVLAAALAGAPAASGQGGSEPAASVNANGNAFSGGLSFTPADVTVPLGGVVRWTNTDFLVPHTSTEDHGLWDLTGDYGPPGGPYGYAPGESVERPFEAGTHKYFCRVHPEDLRGSVAVAPEVLLIRRRERRRTRRGRRRVVVLERISARWAVLPPPEGLAFDVERRKNGGAWLGFREGTRAILGNFRSSNRRRDTWEIRARLRKADDASSATEWSPVASVTG